jgi:hypothetical protein
VGHFDPERPRPAHQAQATTYETYNKGSTLEALPEGKDKIRSKVISVLFMDELGSAARIVGLCKNRGRIHFLSSPARPLSWPILPRQSLK